MATVLDDWNANFAWYGSAWSTDHPNDDSIGSYMNNSFHSSSVNGDYGVVSWHGTDIEIYGARRANHGIYGISVDNGPVQYYSGYSAGAGTFQQVLYASSDLAEADHTLKISNENARNTKEYPAYVSLDVDYVALTGTVMNANPTGAATSSASSAVVISTSSATQSLSSIVSPSSSSADPPSSSTIRTVSSSSATTFSQTGPDSVEPYSGTTSSSLSVVQSASSTNAPILTTGEPQVPTGQSASPSATAQADQQGSSTNNRTTVVAVSVTVIVIAAIVIATILGLWYWRRRRRLREEAEAEQLEYLQRPESSWR